MDSMERWTLKWAHGEATAQSLGGMLAPVRFELGGGRTVSPLYVAPWGDDARWPGLLRALRGEWPCLPFGAVAAPPGLPLGFETRNATDTWNHGYGANHMWRLVEKTADRLTLRIDYPSEEAIESLERTIEVDPEAPALIVSLTVHARRDVVLPFALHPTFAIPDEGVEVLACPYQWFTATRSRRSRAFREACRTSLRFSERDRDSNRPYGRDAIATAGQDRGAVTDRRVSAAVCLAIFHPAGRCPARLESRGTSGRIALD